MELVFAILISGIALLVLALALTKNRDHRSRDDVPAQIDSTVVPFDAGSAKPVANVVLQGSGYVIDGDTLVLQQTQIRLFGIDAPELNHPYGKNAKFALIALCKGEKIRAEIIAKDDHGRTVAKCSLRDGRDLSAEMVKLGMAIDWAKFSGGKYRALEAPDARKKMWLADARQKGRMHVWEKYDARQKARGIMD